MKLDATSANAAGRKVDHVRLDQIGGTSGLWWVARAFDDDSTQPEGMFVNRSDAEELASSLSLTLGVPITVTRFD